MYWFLSIIVFVYLKHLWLYSFKHLAFKIAESKMKLINMINPSRKKRLEDNIWCLSFLLWNLSARIHEREGNNSFQGKTNLIFWMIYWCEISLYPTLVKNRLKLLCQVKVKSETFLLNKLGWDLIWSGKNLCYHKLITSYCVCLPHYLIPLENTHDVVP